MLFTAIAGTVVILPWALPSTPFDEDRRPLAEQTQLAQQPLTGLGGGETIREVHQDTPFSLVALTAADLTGTSARVRAQASPTARGDRGTKPRTSTASATRHRHRAAPNPSSSGSPPRSRSPSTVQAVQRRRRRSEPAQAEPAGPDLGYLPANTNQPFGQNVNAVLISPPQAPIDLPLPNAVTPPGQPPAIITRAQWGADESMKCPNTVYDDGVRAGVVHHTAGSNDYAPAGLRGDRAIDLRVPHPHPWLVRHRLQRPGRQVRAGVRGPRRRHGPAGRGRPHRRVQQEHLGCGDARQLRPRAADADPVTHRRTAARLAARPRPRRPEGHSRFGVRRWFVHPLPRGAPPRRCRRSSPTATSASPTAQAMRPTRRWTRSAISRPASTNRSRLRA